MCAHWENDKTCEDCPANVFGFGCANKMSKFVLGLINRQKAENEKITEKYNCQQTVYVDLSKIIKEQAEELKQAKSEAIKEFAERLIKTAEYDDEYSTVFVYNIKQLVKEMTEVQE